jgi:hypothetical protein
MSRDGYLPDNVSEADIDALYGGDHHPSCPAGEDGQQIFSVCDGEGECVCSWWDKIVSWFYGDKCEGEDQECECADIADDDAADREDARERDHDY